MKAFVASAALYVAAAGIQRLVGMMILVWLATRLSVEEYGKFGLLWAGQQFVTVVALGGIVESVISWVSQSHGSNPRGAFSAGRAAFLVVAGVLLVGTVLLSIVMFSTAQERVDLATVVFGGICLAYATLLASFARLEERHAAANVLATVPPLAAFVGGATLGALTETVSGFFLGSAACCALANVVVQHTAPGPSREERGSHLEVTRMLHASVPLAGAAMFGWLSGYGNNFLIDRLFPAIEIGRYTMALSVAAVVHMIAASLNSVWSPRFYRLFRDKPGPSLEVANRAFYNLLAILLGGAGGGLVLIVPTVARRFGGNLHFYSDIGPSLVVLVAGYVVLTTWWQCTNHLLAHGAGRTILSVTLATGVIGTVIWLALMKVLGTFGIYAGFVVMMAIRSAALLSATRRFATVRWPWRGTLTGCLLLGAAWLVLSVIDGLWLQLVVYVGILVAIVVAVARHDAQRFLAAW